MTLTTLLKPKSQYYRILPSLSVQCILPYRPSARLSLIFEIPPPNGRICLCPHNVIDAKQLTEPALITTGEKKNGEKALDAATTLSPTVLRTDRSPPMKAQVSIVTEQKRWIGSVMISLKLSATRVFVLKRRLLHFIARNADRIDPPETLVMRLIRGRRPNSFRRHKLPNANSVDLYPPSESARAISFFICSTMCTSMNILQPILFDSHIQFQSTCRTIISRKQSGIRP